MIRVHKTASKQTTGLLEQSPSDRWNQRAVVWLDCQHHVWRKTITVFQQKHLMTNVRPSVWQLTLGRNWVVQRDNDLSSKPTSQSLNNLKRMYTHYIYIYDMYNRLIKVQTEMLFWDHNQNSTNFNDKAGQKNVPPHLWETVNVMQVTVQK